MKTAEEIVKYLESELEQAYEMHNQTKRSESKSKAFTSLVKIVLLEQILEDIK